MNRIPRGVLSAEWIKLRSVRSTYLTVLIAVVTALAFGIVDYRSVADGHRTMSDANLARFDPVRDGFSGGFYLAILALGALGVLAMSAEHGTGTIRTTYAAVPRRRKVLVAKVTVLGALTLLTGELLAFAIFFSGQFVLSGEHMNVGLGDRGVLRATAGAGLFLSVFALIGLAFGSIIKRTAGAIVALFGLFFIAPMLTSSLDSWSQVPNQWTLQCAFEGMTSTTTHRPNWPSPGMALVECGVYLAVILGLAALLTTRRDT
jgi:ABC-2 type transport system permease protein